MDAINVNEVELNGVKYVRKDSIKESAMAQSLEGKPYVIVRTDRAGVFAGYLDSRNNKEARILKARRIWYWSGAASLSQLSVDGTKKPNECKFPCEVEYIDVTDVIEVIPCTEVAEKSIKSVKVWQQ